jgi:hypothetical protein
MATPGVDYFAAQSNEAEECLRTIPKYWVGRYYDASGGTSQKCLKPAEVASLHSNDLAILSVYETVPTYYGYFSYAQGQFDAGQAKARAQACGQWTNVPIFFGIDYDASSAELFGQITEYFNGVYATMNGAFPLGVYGSYRVVEHAAAQWPIAVPWRWQTYAWSGGQVSAYRHAYQYLNDTSYCGVSLDLDESYSDYIYW